MHLGWQTAADPLDFRQLPGKNYGPFRGRSKVPQKTQIDQNFWV